MARTTTLLLLLACCAAAAAAAQPVNITCGDAAATADATFCSSLGGWRGEIVRLAWEPRAYHLKGFLTDDECDHIMREANASLEASGVVDSDTGEGVFSDVRTSTGMFFDHGHDAVIARVEERVALVSMVPASHQEGLQVLRYINGQKYDAHYDYFFDEKNADPRTGGQRLLTVLMYLTTPEAGGETVFPDVAEELRSSGDAYSECAHQGLAHKPRRGDALLFYSLKPDGTMDPASLHASCPTTKGEKWSATKWIHVGPFKAEVPGEAAETVEAAEATEAAEAEAEETTEAAEALPEPYSDANAAEAAAETDGAAAAASADGGVCEDTAGDCALWASNGECDGTYKEFMHEQCRFSCNLCTPAAAATAGDDGKAPAPTFGAGAACEDESEHCGFWAAAGECDANHKEYMQESCRRSCRLCGSAALDAAGVAVS